MDPKQNERELGVAQVEGGLEGARVVEENAGSVARRNLVALLGGSLGLLSMACSAEGASEETIAQVEQAASGATTSYYFADTIVELAALNPTGVGAIALLRGYTAIGDGGGGIFYWSTVQQVDDRGLIVNATAGGSAAGWRRLTTAAEISGLSTYSGAPKEVSVRWFGARGDGVQDDQAAVTRAVNAVKPNGGTVLFPPGKYVLSGTINCDQTGLGTGKVTLRGLGGAKLVFSTSGTTPLISARSSGYFGVEDLRISVTNSAFTGHVIDLSRSGVNDTAYALIQRIQFTSDGGQPASFVRLSGTIISTVRDCSMSGATIGVVGSVAGDPYGYSNVNRIENVTFMSQGQAGIVNPGEAWTISGCTFEPLSTGAAGGIRARSDSSPKGVNINGCWFGDAGTGNWIEFETGLGVSISGSFFYGSAGTAIVIRGGEGYSISGNGIWSGCCVQVSPPNGFYVQGLAIVGNTMHSSTASLQLSQVVRVTVEGNYGLYRQSDAGMILGEGAPTNEAGIYSGYLSALPQNKLAGGVAYLDGAVGVPHCSLGIFPSSRTDQAAEVVLMARNGAGNLEHRARFGPGGVGFYGTAPVAKPVVTGSWSAGTAQKSVLAALVALGLAVDQTTA